MISREQFKSAVTVLDEAIGISPGSLAIRRDRARVLKHLKLFQRSLDDMEWIYVVQKKSETDSKAGKVYEDKDLIIEIAELHQLFAGWLMEQPVEGQMAIFQREEKVMGHYQKAIELRPQESRYYKIFAQFLEKIKRLEDAVDMYTLYLSKQQHDPDVTERSVYLLIKLANQTAMQDEKGMRLALRRYSRALELQPTNMDALFGRVRLYVRMQSYQEAKADLLQILQLEPGQADAVRMLMEVKSHEGSIVD